jgi:hypothetical protein
MSTESTGATPRTDAIQSAWSALPADLREHPAMAGLWRACFDVLPGTAEAAGARCIKPHCPETCCGCNHAIRADDEVAVLVADLLTDAGVDGHGAPYEDGEHPVVDRARAFLCSRTEEPTPAQPEPQPVARFGHHPDPVIDFCVEVEALEAEHADRKAGLPSTMDMEARIFRAMTFRAGVVKEALDAKAALRRLDAVYATAPEPQPVAQDADALYDRVKQVLLFHRLSNMVCDDDHEDHLPLVDALTPPGSKDISTGQDEIALICDAIYNEVLKPAHPAPEPQERTRSQKLRDAGFTRRPSWKSLPSDGDDEPQERKALTPLTDEQIEAGRAATFSTGNPFCPCDSKTMRKAVRWAEHAHGIDAAIAKEQAR